jgi:hypothetical protein
MLTHHTTVKAYTLVRPAAVDCSPVVRICRCERWQRVSFRSFRVITHLTIKRSNNKEVVSKNSYLYLYPQVEIRTYIRWVSGGYRISIEFVIPHVKTTLK